jgi:ADP-heptose:LPS heptosyltransferase
VPLADKNLVHIVERIANLLLPFGINPSKSNLDIEFRLNPSEIKLAKEEMPESFNKKILGINLSGSSRAKFWGTSNFIDFINRVYMNHSEFEVVIFAMPDYQKELDEILGSTKAVKAPNSNSFTQFASHISACNLILSPDTSVVHLASAFKIPCISLHLWTGTSDTGMPWHSYNAPHKVLKTNTNDLTQILVEDVYTAFEELNKGENL